MSLLQRREKTLAEKLQHLIKELLEELVLYWMKFKAWLTPGTSDDKAVEAAARAEDKADALKAKFR